MVLRYDINKVIDNEIKYVDLDAVAQKARTKKYASVYDDIKKENKNLPNNNNDVLFQILDWNPYHEDDDNGQKIYAIRLFGMTKDDRTICVNVKKYTPYFYVKIPENWRASMVDSLMTYVKKKVFPKENLEGLISCQTVNKYDFYGFTNYTKFNYLQLTFKDHDSMRSYERVFKKPMKIFQISKDEFTLKLYESNIEPFLRCMHIRNLDSVGWVSIQAAKYNVTIDDPTLSDINIECAWTELNRVDDRTILPYRIAAFDIECKSGDGTFPQAYRDEDKIIQIGTTFSKFGENECYFQHIITLGTCDEIPGITVESYETEQEVLIAWLKLITRTNPDIITGYNIFGFDFVYLKDRAKKLGIYDRFSKLTRIKNLNAEWKEKQLASAALGDNLLKYFDMSGRVLIDMMKVIQRDYKLEGYKLDYAASYFIKEQVQKLILKANDKQHVDPELFENFFDKTNTIKSDEDKDTTMIETKSTYGVKEDNYITIYYTDGIANNKHMDGKKFKIKELTKTTLTVYGIINDDIIGKGYKIYWCQAKDDISPKDIFRLQKGTSKDRAIIARYCIMDCALCNKLMAKLQVLTNNIGMANVCNVPLSYLFMRGQGVKIYSLVSKKCREKQHLIPTLAKEFRDEAEEEQVKQEEKKIEKLIARLNGDDQEDDEEEEEEGYEGAIVFPPIPGVYYEPIPVLDYASLYPRSMIHKNLSHECFVIDDGKYGYLPGYNYNIIPYITKTIKQQYDRRLLRDLIKAYDNNDNFIIDELDVDPAKLRRHVIVYDKDYNGNKRYKIADIQADRDNIIMINYETDKFAEKEDGTKGIIPEILLELLAARSKYKKEMEKETDPFKKSILDGLQLAYKVTANSLYGQTGSEVSPIFMKSIAASTTATGREMLIFSKYFIENIYGKMINYALTDKDEFMKYCFETFKDAVDKKFKKTTKEKVKNPDGTETYVVVPEESWDNRQEFFEKFYDKINIVFVGKTVNPYIVYGDSVSADTPIIVKNGNNVEIKQISDVGKEWKPYDAFKNSEVNEYFINIINILLKSKDDVEQSKTRYKNESLIDVTKWFGGKNIGTIFIANGQCVVSIERKNTKRIIKSFSIAKYGEKEAQKIANEFVNKTNDDLGIARNRIRIKLDLNTSEKYVEIQLTNDKMMLCDIDDLDIVNDNIWFENDKYAKCADGTKFHKAITNKLVKKLPKIISSKIESFSVDHINQNTLDNRKNNLRLIPVREQSWNRGLFDTNTSGTNGVTYMSIGKGVYKYCAFWVNFEGKRRFRHFDLKTDAIQERLQQQNLILEQFENDRSQLINELKKLLLEDQKNRYSKEQLQIKGNIYTDDGWSKINRIIRHKTQKKMYRIVTNTGVCDVTEDHSLLSIDKKQIKPKDCSVGIELLHSFPNSFHNLCVNIDEQKYDLPIYVTSDKIECAKYYYVSKKNGYNVKIDICKDTYVLIKTKEPIKEPNKIIKIIQLNDITESEYVYDVETKSGKFNAGIGELVVTNTDSVFFNMMIKDNSTGIVGRDKNALIQCITAGQWASHTICTLLPDYQEQAYEKVLWPFMIITKKRYVGNLYEDNPDKFYQKSMGIVLKRRDNAQIVKIVCGGIVDQILNKHDPMGAVKLLQRSLKDILSGKFQMDKYIITKTLRENYKDRTRIAHAILADRMGLRDPGNKPMSNDRIPYAYVVTDHEVELQGDRIETPDYITSNNLKLDYLFYITNQIQKPATQFLELIIDNPKRLFESYIIREENRRKGVKPIKTYLEEINNNNKNTDDDFNIDDKNDSTDDDINNENNHDNMSNDDNILNKKKKRKRKKKLIKYK